MLPNSDENQLDITNLKSKFRLLFQCDDSINDIAVSDDHQLIAISTRLKLSDRSRILNRIIVSKSLYCHTCHINFH